MTRPQLVEFALTALVGDHGEVRSDKLPYAVMDSRGVEYAGLNIPAAHHTSTLRF